MHKISLLLLAVYAASVSAYQVVVRNNAGCAATFPVSPGNRYCFCLKSILPNTIQGVNGGDIRLFSSYDCTGNYAKLGPNSLQTNAAWVHSFSMGASGIVANGTNGACPDWFYGDQCP